MKILLVCFLGFLATSGLFYLVFKYGMSFQPLELGCFLCLLFVTWIFVGVIYFHRRLQSGNSGLKKELSVIVFMYILEVLGFLEIGLVYSGELTEISLYYLGFSLAIFLSTLISYYFKLPEISKAENLN